MGKQVDRSELDKEVADILDFLKQESIRQAIEIFNEGYLLGREHERKLSKGENEN